MHFKDLLIISKNPITDENNKLNQQHYTPQKNIIHKKKNLLKFKKNKINKVEIEKDLKVNIKFNRKKVGKDLGYNPETQPHRRKELTKKQKKKDNCSQTF